MPQNAPGRIVIVTDGLLSDAGRLQEALSQSAARGVPVDVQELHPNRPPDTELAELRLPSRMEPGRPFDLPVRLRSNQSGEVTVRIFQNDVLVREIPIAVHEGFGDSVIRGLVPDGGITSWRAEVVAPGDTNPANNSLTRLASGSGRTRVVAVDPDPSSLSAAVRALEQAGMSVETRRPEGLPENPESLAGADMILLSDTSASALGTARQQALLRWVSELGGGLLVTGGSNAFSAGGYYGSPLAAALPVRVDFDDAAELSTVALYVSLDRSGSMSATVDGVTKMALANAGAVRAMELLDPSDFFGLAAVDTQVYSIISPSRITDPTAAARIIESITPGGGGIYVFTALAAAYRELSSVDAQVKHLILFSDAADAEEKTAPPGSGMMANAFDVVSAMLAARMTVSVVALGSESDKDTEFLRTLASKGGGRFYLTSDATTLPQIFAEETLRATQNSLIETPFQAQVAMVSTAIQGIAWAEAPELLGYNAVLPKELATTSLVTADGTPLFASWRRGLGQIAAFASDIHGRWSADWLDWPGFGQWLNQSVRTLARSPESGRLTVEIEEVNDRLRVILSARDALGRFEDGLQPSVTLTEGVGSGKTIAARQFGAGQYVADFSKPTSGSALASVSLGEGRAPAFGTWVQDATGEPWVLRDTKPIFAEVAATGSGRLNPETNAIFAEDGRTKDTHTEAFPWLLGLALVLWPIDIWLRRRDWSSQPRPARVA
jgi:uncharacterized membrane protein